MSFFGANRRLLSLTAVSLLWVTGIAWGFRAAWIHDTTAGVAAAHAVSNSKTEWPQLLVFIHPDCPCSRATLAELMRIKSDTGAKLQLTIYFVEPDGWVQDPATADLWDLAAAIPDAKIVTDSRAKFARMYDAHTSGQVLLFDAQGAVRFSGGVTIARGHAGDNAGSQIIITFVISGQISAASSPVYGCSLW